MLCVFKCDPFFSRVTGGTRTDGDRFAHFSKFCAQKSRCADTRVSTKTGSSRELIVSLHRNFLNGELARKKSFGHEIRELALKETFSRANVALANRVVRTSRESVERYAMM